MNPYKEIFCYDYSTIAGAHESILEYLQDHKSDQSQTNFFRKRLAVHNNNISGHFFYKNTLKK